MKQNKKNAFTLIELIATLVIMAIIALIATPLVMNIIRSARISADKRSIDAYGRSIELAIAGYLMDTGDFPTSIEQLTIEYSGEEVVCSTTNLNADSSIYLAGCTVGGRSVEGYTYGKEETTPAPTYNAYSVGDHVSYNGVTYYVIEDSSASNDTVKLLKEDPLLKTEIDALNLSGVNVTENNSYGQVDFGSSTDYSQSTVKQVVDAWKNTVVANGDTATARLISFEELINNFGYVVGIEATSYHAVPDDTPSWLYNSNYIYWTNSEYNSTGMWIVTQSYLAYGNIFFEGQPNTTRMVRPVLELNKSAEITKLN